MTDRRDTDTSPDESFPWLLPRQPARAAPLAAPALATLVAGLLLVACSSNAPAPENGGDAGVLASVAPAPAAATTPARAGGDGGADGGADGHHDSALHNVRRWSERIVQGAGPSGEAAFQELAAMGIKTVVSVDGAMPPVELAETYGMTYVHVPIGYDGIDADEQARIVKAVRDAPGPVFLHCHHGTHRGPAAAAIARVAVDGVSTEDAYAGLKETCSPSYAGLYEAVADFVPPSAEVLAALPPLPSKVAPAGVAAAMVEIDERWESMKASKAKGWTVLADAPDRSPPHEASILRELFRELHRDEEARTRGEDFLERTQGTETLFSALEVALRAADPAGASTAADAIAKSCKACHAAHRD